MEEHAFELPEQAVKTREIVPAKVFKTFASGSFLETVKMDSGGNVYTSKTEGADMLQPFPPGSKLSGQIIKVTQDGHESVFADVPISHDGLLGVLVFDKEGVMYVNVHSPSKPDVHGVWRYTADGQGKQFAAFPADSWPNGITIGPDGNLYVADSNLGAVWIVDTTTAVAEKWVQGGILSCVPGLPVPGPNGIQSWQNDIFVAISIQNHIARVPLLPDGQAGEPVVHATGIGGDDFAVDVKGNLYVTTHPHNTVVRISTSGEQTIIATKTEGIVGATDAAFSTLPGEENILYVATDGGLYEHIENPIPSIIKLDVGAG